MALLLSSNIVPSDCGISSTHWRKPHCEGLRAPHGLILREQSSQASRTPSEKPAYCRTSRSRHNADRRPSRNDPVTLLRFAALSSHQRSLPPPHPKPVLCRRSCGLQTTCNLHRLALDIAEGLTPQPPRRWARRTRCHRDRLGQWQSNRIDHQTPPTVR